MPENRRCNMTADTNPNTTAKFDLDAAASIRPSSSGRLFHCNLNRQQLLTFGDRRLW